MSRLGLTLTIAALVGAIVILSVIVPISPESRLRFRATLGEDPEIQVGLA